MALPAQVVDVFGYALYLAQIGERHDQAKPLRGLEKVQEGHSDTEAGHGLDQGQIKGRGCAGEGA